MTPTAITRTVQVIVRHGVACPDRDEGTDWKRCHCRKSLLVYDGETKKNKRIAANTRSWEQAEQFAREYVESFDPLQQELKRYRAAEEAKQVSIETAVASYLGDMVARLGDKGTAACARSLLGRVDPNTKAVLKNGHLFDWIYKQVPRPLFVSELTIAAMTNFRATWDCGDLTGAQRLQVLKNFFEFCVSRYWIKENPARKLKKSPIRKGNRTVVFTDGQYEAIIAAIQRYEVPLPESNQNARKRLRVFVELLRWTGMDLIDVIQFRHELVDKDGVLRYRRQKTGQLGTIPLPAHLIALLRDIPPESGSVLGMPFCKHGITSNGNVKRWQIRLGNLFELAGITEVTTEHGRTRRPHAKMFRDYCAVSALRNGVSLKGVARMLGHSSVVTTERHYLPFVKELQDAHVEDARKALVNTEPKSSGAVVNIAARR